MTSRNHSTRIVSLAVGLLVCGMANFQAARAQDSEPSATASTDPNAGQAGASQAPAPGGAPPAVQQEGAAAYKPFVLMPFVGVQSIQNANSNTGPGLRIGGVVGARMTDQFSFNGELLFDLENFSNVPPGFDESAYFIQAAAAPLFHVQASPTAEIVLGPKLGMFVDHVSASGGLGAYTVNLSGNAEGYLLGANVGAFFRVSDALSLGGLVNFDYLREEWCSANQGTCTVSDNGIKVISFAGAAQF
jgi:hypothetical protein